MEDGLRVAIAGAMKEDEDVLILVVMEDGLREQKMQCDDH